MPKTSIGRTHSAHLITPETSQPVSTGVHSLRLNFFWALAGNVLFAGTQWGIIASLARLGNATQVGQFSLGLAVASPIMLFAALQLRSVQATDVRKQVTFRDYAGLRLLMTIIAASVICAIGNAIYSGEDARVIVAFAVAKSIEALSDLAYGLWQQQDRMDLIAKSLMLRGVLALFAADVCFVAFHSVCVAIYGIAVAWACAFVLFDARYAILVTRQSNQIAVPRFAAAKIKSLLSTCLPLGIVSMLLSLTTNVPRYMISHFCGVRELGIFSALGYVLLAGTMVVGSLGQSSTVRLAKYSSQGMTKEFRELAIRLLQIGMGIGLCGVFAALFFGRQILEFIYGAEYAKYDRLFIWLMIAAGVGYMAAFSGYILTAARHFRVQTPLFSSLTALMVVLSLTMVRAEGVQGAAKALAAVNLVQLAATLGILYFRETRRTTGI